jgi:hypothetical protein
MSQFKPPSLHLLVTYNNLQYLSLIVAHSADFEFLNATARFTDYSKRVRLIFADQQLNCMYCFIQILYSNC